MHRTLVLLNSVIIFKLRSKYSPSEQSKFNQLTVGVLLISFFFLLQHTNIFFQRLIINLLKHFYYIDFAISMIYNQIKTTGKDLGETALEPSKKQEDLVNFLQETPFFSHQKTYIYPTLEEATPFYQFIVSSTLDAISLIPSVKFAIFSLLLIAFYMGLFGVILLGVSVNILELRIPYGKQCNGTPQCTLEFTLDTLFPIPVYLYYELSDFHSNEKRFIGSINREQMAGKDISSYKDACPNAYLVEQMPTRANFSAQGYVMNNRYANPCGLAVQNVFNDTFFIYNSEGVKEVNSSSLVLPMYDDNFVRHKFFQFVQWLDVKNQRVIGWLTPQIHSFRFVLWGVINANMYPGTYKLYINNNYPLSVFEGEKTLILTSASELGTKNNFLGFLLTSCSGTLVLLAIAIYLMTRNKQSAMIRPEDLSANLSQYQPYQPYQNQSNTNFIQLSQSQIQTSKLKQM